MTTIVFDTYAAVQELRAAGFSEAQAAAIVKAQSTSLSQLATKDDLSTLEQRLTIKLGGVAVVIAGIAVAILRLPH